MDYQIIYIILSFLIGCVIACAELLSRYKVFKLILKNWSGIIYLLINGISSIAAFYILGEMNILENNDLIRVMFAGASSMLILRSSIANIKVGDRNINAGVADAIQVFLDFAESSFDLKRSQDDAQQINKIMSNVSFDKSKTSLPYTCFNLMKRISEEEKKMVEDAIIELNKSNHPERIKSLNLGIILSRVTRLEFLKTAVETLGDDIKSNVDHVDEIDDILKKLRWERGKK